MANRLAPVRQSPSRPPIRLLTSVLLLGTFLAWWGTRDDPRLFGESPRTPVAAGRVDFTHVTQDERAMFDRGSDISQHQCAGCHEMARRSSGPSYQEIMTFYRRSLPPSAGVQDVRERLATAVTHPPPGWGNFAPGPVESQLSLDDRIALATWILRSVDREKHAGEGAGQ
jgi:cytochrome c551/c552